MYHMFKYPSVKIKGMDVVLVFSLLKHEAYGFKDKMFCELFEC